MRLDELTKTQIVLLTLLVSFVTSIATGIATVSLMEQAPSDVTRIIDKVVERTVEKVVPTQGASVITREKTVIVRDEDAVKKAIQTVQGITTSLYSLDAEGKELFIGLGFVVASDGTIVTDSDLVSSEVIYTAHLPNGTTLRVQPTFQSVKYSVALLRPVPTTPPASLKDIVFGTLGKPDAVQLGQTALAVSGENVDTVMTGIVSGLSYENVQQGTSTDSHKVLGQIKTTLGRSSLLPGTPLTNLFGDVVGMFRGASETATFLPANVIADLLQTHPATTPTATP